MKQVLASICLGLPTIAWCGIIGCDPSCSSGSLLFSGFEFQRLFGREPGVFPIPSPNGINFIVSMRNDGTALDLFRVAYNVMVTNSDRITGSNAVDIMEGDPAATACVNHSYSSHGLLNCANFAPPMEVALGSVQSLHVVDTISITGGLNGESSSIRGFGDQFTLDPQAGRSPTPEPASIVCVGFGLTALVRKLRGWEGGPGKSFSVLVSRVQQPKKSAVTPAASCTSRDSVYYT